MTYNNFTELRNFVKLATEKYKPISGHNYRCIELEHIDKGTGILLGSDNSVNKSSTKNYFQAGDTLFGKLRPNLKKFFFPDFSGVCSTEIWVLKADIEKCNKVFLYYLVQSPKFVFTACKTTGSKMPRADWNYLSLEVFYLPTLLEQQKIANILRVWDKDIEILTKLCDAKRKSYNVIARNIFDTQAKKEKWQAVKLSTISSIKKGKQLNRLDMKGGIYPVWNGGIIPSGFTDQWNMEANTITISEGGSCGFVNLCKEKFWLGGHCYSVTNLAANLNKCFLFFQLKQNEPRIMRLKTGSGLPNIQKPSIENYVVYIPSLEQQTKIANYLNSLCDEIEIYKKELQLIKKQKQGLVQKLITGKWHLKIDE
ncbi:MAG: restriction endonuclease subunit S [Janthinobacterium lividum]